MPSDEGTIEAVALPSPPGRATLAVAGPTRQWMLAQSGGSGWEFTPLPGEFVAAVGTTDGGEVLTDQALIARDRNHSDVALPVAATTPSFVRPAHGTYHEGRVHVLFSSGELFARAGSRWTAVVAPLPGDGPLFARLQGWKGVLYALSNDFQVFRKSESDAWERVALDVPPAPTGVSGAFTLIPFPDGMVAVGHSGFWWLSAAMRATQLTLSVPELLRLPQYRTLLTLAAAQGLPILALPQCVARSPWDEQSWVGILNGWLIEVRNDASGRLVAQLDGANCVNIVHYGTQLLIALRYTSPERVALIVSQDGRVEPLGLGASVPEALTAEAHNPFAGLFGLE